MILGVLKEEDGEKRVALSPDAVAGLLKAGFQTILIEKGAGDAAFFEDSTYTAQGAETASAEQLHERADVLVRITALPSARISKLRKGQVLISQLNPLANHDLVKAYLGSGASVFSLDMVPRSTRAQAMDVLSSMATVAGYKAVLTAAGHAPTFFPMLMTAAGTIKPAKVLILGAGVAGLQAISAARRLGAVVEAFDVRAAAKEEVLSLGAKFVEVTGASDDKAAGGYAVEQSEEFKQRQAQAIHDHAAQANVVICTAQIPGRKAPLLLRAATVEAMRPGSVVVDLAASSGGNCELTQNAQTVVHKGVSIIGDSNLAASIPKDASAMYSKNVVNFLKLFFGKEGFKVNFEDDIVAAACIAHEGTVVSERMKSSYDPK